MTIAIAIIIYVVTGLAILIYFDCYAGWPDAGQAMQVEGCVVAVLFLPSFGLYVVGRWAWDKLRGKPDGRG